MSIQTYEDERTSDLSEKNPLITLTSTATILSVLELFSRGTHRGLESNPKWYMTVLKPEFLVIIEEHEGHSDVVSDTGLLAWFIKHVCSWGNFISSHSEGLTRFTGINQFCD